MINAEYMISTHGDTEEAQKQSLMESVELRYGNNAEFAYPVSDNDPGVLSIEDLVKICGDGIVKIKAAKPLTALFDLHYNHASQVNERGEDAIISARKKGKATLDAIIEKRGL